MLISNYLSSNIIICICFLTFDLTHFRELGQNYRNILVPFLVQIKTLKFASEINWPLVIDKDSNISEGIFIFIQSTKK